MNPQSDAGLPDFVGNDGKQKSNSLHIWGNRETMNLNSMLLTNIKQSPYYKTELVELKTFHEVVDEIYYKVTHLEPWERGSRRTAGLSGASGGGLQVRGVGAGGIVSTAFCLLYKLFCLRISRKHLQTLIDHPDSPYIRGLGFMFIRYCIDPKEYWAWFEPYFEDKEEIEVKAGGGCCITIGDMLRQLLSKQDWYSTLFPRIPVPVDKDLRSKLAARAPAANSGAAAAAARREVDNGEDHQRHHHRQQQQQQQHRDRRRSRSPHSSSHRRRSRSHSRERHHRRRRHSRERGDRRDR